VTKIKGTLGSPMTPPLKFNFKGFGSTFLKGGLKKVEI